MEARHRDTVFSLFYNQVVANPDQSYLTYNEQTLSYQEAYTCILNIVEFIRQHPLAHQSVALNFMDQRKLLLSFWACVALEIDTLLVPGLEVDLEGLRRSDHKLETDLMLTDFVKGKGCYDVEFHPSPLTPPIRFEEFSPSTANLFFFTSGTTGKSKFVKTSYYQLTMAMKCIKEHHLMPYTVAQKVLITVPLFHSYGLSAAIEYTQGGSHLFVPKSKDHLSPLQALMSKVVGEQITAIEGVPYFYKQMIAVTSRLKLPFLQHIGMGGDAVPSELLEKMNDFNPSLSFSVRYGVTEIPSVVSVNLFHHSENYSPKGLGKILPIYHVELHSEDGNVNEDEGEMVIDFLLYPNESQRISTGDLMERCHTTFVFRGRKTFLKYKGYKINPIEVEECLNAHPSIYDSKVYLNNDVLTADLVVDEEKVPDPKEIKNYLLPLINSYQIPDRYLIVDSIKRTKTGKVVRG